MKSAAKPAKKKSTKPAKAKSKAKPVTARPDLVVIYNQIKPLLAKYAPPFSDGESRNVSGKVQYGLTMKKKVVVNGREIPELYFAGLIQQKDYVGFYLIAPYFWPEFKKKLSPTMLKMLKGKSCFYVKSAEKAVLDDIREALKLSFQEYKRQGWV